MQLVINPINGKYPPIGFQDLGDGDVEDGEEFEIKEGYQGTIAIVSEGGHGRSDYWKKPEADSNEFDLNGLLDELREESRCHRVYSLDSLIDWFEIKITIFDFFGYYWGNPEEVNSMEFDPYGEVINLKAGKYKLEGNIIHIIKGDDG